MTYVNANTLLFLTIETKGRTLEEMDEIFGGHSAVHDAQIMDEVQNKLNQQHPLDIVDNKSETRRSNAV